MYARRCQTAHGSLPSSFVPLFIAQRVLVQYCNRPSVHALYHSRRGYVCLTPSMLELQLLGLFGRLIQQHPCAKEFGQCGGDNWNGAKCCPGTTCHTQSQFYSQCIAIGGDTTIANAAAAPAYHAASIGVARGSNVFASHQYYVGNDYQQRVKISMAARWAEGTALSQMERMLSVPSAFWVDRIAKIGPPGGEEVGAGATLDGILADAQRKGTANGGPPLVVAIMYNLPNRDCHAFASNGELCCEYLQDRSCKYDTADSSCSVGLSEYRHDYVDKFVDAIARHPTVPLAIIVEPDSLPNVRGRPTLSLATFDSRSLFSPSDHSRLLACLWVLSRWLPTSTSRGAVTWRRKRPTLLASRTPSTR